MSRPNKAIDRKKLKALMRLKPTLEDTAAFFECSGRTIERVIREHFDLSFVEFREQNMVHTRLELVRTALEKAGKGDNVMLIFCLKNLCGWTNKDVVMHEGLKPSILVKTSGERVEFGLTPDSKEASE